MPRRPIANVPLLLLSVLCALALVEALTAVFHPQRILQSKAEDIFFTQYDPEIGWVNREGASGTYRPNPETRATTVRINEQGFRGDGVSIPKPPGSRRVLLLGDSNTFGYGMEEEERFSDLLSERLPGNHEVANLGVFGYGTDQELLLFQRVGRIFEPDIVVLGFSAGDVSDNMSSINATYSKPYFRLEAGGGLTLKNTPVPRSLIYMRGDSRGSRLKGLIYRNSHLFRLIMYRLVSSDLYMPGSVLEMTREEGLKTTVALLNRLRDACRGGRAGGARLVVLLIPHETWVAASSAGAGAKAGYYSVFNRMLTGSGIAVVDTSDALVSSQMKGTPVFLANDPVHLNARGNELAAEALYQGLLKHGLIEETGSAGK
jgi:lysophospholipase L1-like esterase